MEKSSKENEKKYEDKLRTICETGKFKALSRVIRTTDELKLGFEGADLTQPLHYFAGRGNIEAVRKLIETHGCNPQCQNLHGVTPLHCACYCGKVGVVKYLVNRQKCNMNIRDEQGVPPLAYTAYCVMKNVTVMSPLNCFHVEPQISHVRTAIFLLNMQRGYSTVSTYTLNELHVLRLPVYCNSKLVEFLCIYYNLKWNVEANYTELKREMLKCLEIAIDESKWEFVQNLVHNQIDIFKEAVTITTNSTEATAPTLFHKICRNCDLNLVKIFLKHGIFKPDTETIVIAIYREHYELVNCLLSSAEHQLLMDRYRSYSSLLSYIFECHQDDEKLLRLIVAITGSCEVRDADGNTPLHLACKHCVAPDIMKNYSAFENLNEDKELPVHVACRSKENLQAIKYVSSQLGTKINLKNKDGNTPIHIICMSHVSGYRTKKSYIFECFKYLILEKNCDLNIANEQQELPLHVYLKYQDDYFQDDYETSEQEELLRMISNIDCSAINTQDADGNTPLHLACMNSDTIAVTYLTSQFECDVNLINSEGCLPLHIALASCMPLEVVSIVGKGWSKKHLQNKNKETPLHIACRPSMLQYRLSSEEQNELLDIVSDENSVNCKDRYNNTPLHYACKRGSQDKVFYLIFQLGCDVNLLNNEQCLPLHYALESHMSIEVIKAICSRCTMKYKQNMVGKTPLHVACEELRRWYHWSPDNNKQLLELTTDDSSINSQDKGGNTPLHIACQNNDEDAAVYLVSNPHCDVNVSNNKHCLPLHNAVRCDNPLKTVKAAVKGCTLAHMQDKDGMTPLHIACKKGNVDVATHLVFEGNCNPSYHTLSSNIYDNLDIRLACKDETDIELLKALANEQNVIKKYKYDYSDYDQRSPLHVACHHQNVLAIELLIKLNGDVLCRDFLGRTPLHIACLKSLRCVLPLNPIMNNNIVNMCDNNKNTPLHLAFEENHLDIVRFLLSNFMCDVNTKNGMGELPLHMACFNKNLDMVKMVIERCDHSSINDQTNRKDSPIHLACKAGALDVVKFLVEEFNCKSSMILKNEDGKLPIDYACQHSLAMVKFVSEPCTVSDLRPQKYTPRPVSWRLLFNRTLFYSQARPTTLDIACSFGSLDIVEYLITQKDCSLSALENNHSALGYACGLLCINSSKPGPVWLDIVKYLIAECGYNPGVSIENQSVCDFACQQHNVELVKALTICSIDITDLTSGNTLLHYACLHGCTEIIQFLVDRGCDQTIVNQNGELAVHIASGISLKDTQLLTKCDINSLNADGETPLHIACKSEKVDILKYLVDDAKCDINIPNAEGDHPLHIACQKSLKLECLVYEGDINCLDADEDTPLHIACLYHDYDMIKLLLSNQKCRADIADDDDLLALHYLVSPPKDQPYLNTDKENLIKTVQSLHSRYSSAIERPDRFGYTPIEFAIKMGETDLFEILFEIGTFDDKQFKQLLYYACRYGQAHIVKVLFDHEIRFSNEIQDAFQYLYERNSFLETLKELGPIDITKQDENGDTLMHLACKRDSEDVLQYLLQVDDNCCNALSVPNNKKITPLHLLAVKKLSPRLLASIKCDNPNVKGEQGNTPLHLACKRGCIDNAKHLINVCHCDRNVPNESLELPIHVAACQSVKELVKMLATPENVQAKTDNDDTPLHIACKQAELDVVEFLISFKCDLALPNKQGDTPLHIAVARSLKLLDMLYTSSGTLNVNKCLTNNYGDTLLHIACRTADCETVTYLINTFKFEVGVINERNGALPLHYACERGLLPVISLVSNCDPLAKIKDTSLLPKDMKLMSTGDTPLHVACRKGNINVIKHLLISGHIKALKCFNDLEELPVHIAFTHNLNKAMIDLFVAYRRHYDTNAGNDCGDTPLHIICQTQPQVKYIKSLVHMHKKSKCKINVPNKEGNLPLHVVCKGKSISKGVITALSRNLIANELALPNNDGNTALHLILQCPHDYRETQRVKHILQNFFHRMSSVNSFNLSELIPLVCRYQTLVIVKYFFENLTTSLIEVPLSVLHETCLNSNQGVLNYVLRKFEFNVNIENATKDLPLHLAARTKGCMMSTFLLLIMKTVNINHENDQGNIFLHDLYSGDQTFSESEAMTACLSAKGVDFSIQNLQEQTPLHCMLIAGRCQNLKFILTQMKIDPNIKDNEGRTLLHIACQVNNFKAAKLLLTIAKADVSLQDNKGQTPLTLATDPDIIKLLTEHGADPKPLYEMHRNFFEYKQPPHRPVNLMFIGHPSVGKTTLTHSLQDEIFFWKTKISETEFGHTAGIIPTNFNSIFYGDVTFYDFAGQPEYYASHDAVIHNTIKNIPPIVLIVTNLTDPDKIIFDQLHFWINFIHSRCSGLSDKAHLLVIGSHADILERDGVNPSVKVSLLHKVVMSQVQDKMVILKDIIHLNCTEPHSDAMKRLRDTLQTSTSALRETGVMHFKSHCFYVLLLEMFKSSSVVTLGRVISTLKWKAKKLKENPLYVVPTGRVAVIKLCQDLNEEGHIMFIEHPIITDMSWLIINKVPLFNAVTGSLFAPLSFPQHCPLSYNTGVVPLSWFEKQVCSPHKYPAHLALTFLNRMEYCREIKDEVVLKSIIEEEGFSIQDKYYFFPSLVSLKEPKDKWTCDPDYPYKCGWLIQCKTEGEFFSPHFIQALLLRLTFSFTPKKIEYDTGDLETYKCNSELDESSKVKQFMIKRLCSVWKNGIYWQEESGVKTLVEVLNQRTLVLLMECCDGCEIELVKRRSQIISMTLSARGEFCSEARVLEYFIHPKCVQHPLLDLESIQNHFLE
jgi:ankyrin repeat protein